MPSSSAKQHRFMQAVAHNPSFAKKAGVSQSVGKDFSAADKGKTFNKGGMMKKGKRFNGEDGESGVEYHDYDPDKTYSGRFTDDETVGLAENTPTRSTAKAAPAAPATKAATATRAAPAARAAPTPTPTPAASTSRPITNDAEAAKARAANTSSGTRDYISPAQEAYLSRREQDKEKSDQNARELARTPRAKPASGFSETGGRKEFRPAYANYDTPGYAADEIKGTMGRSGDPKYKRVVTGEQKDKNAENFGTVATALIPGGTVIKGAQLAYKGLSAAEKLRKLDKANVPMREIIEARRAAGYAGRKKGGAIMESKKMMGKEVAFMKKKGAPSSMIKHEKAEMGMKAGGMARGGMPPEVMAAMRAKQAARQQPMRRPPPGGMPPPAQPPMGMKKGGVAKFAKGGGIESRGKTKGTVIRMAAGGSVSSRADGIAQRGKTKFTNY